MTTSPPRPAASRPHGARSAVLTWALSTAGFVGFPQAGLAGTALAGRVDDPLAAVVGVAVAGLGIGAVQARGSRRRLPALRWVAATGAGMGVGLLLGAVAVGHRTGLSDLAVQGALTGLVLGPVQALALPGGTERPRRWLWAAAAPALWALGWTATALGGIDVESQYTVFGAYGALTYSALSGLLLIAVLPRVTTDVGPFAVHRRSP